MGSSEKYVSEAELNAKAVAPRITLEQLEANITAEYFINAGRAIGPGVPGHPSLDLLTFCILVLKNGFVVVGQSACASPENYDEDIGNRVARGDAIRQVWAFLGYGLRDQLHRIKENTNGDDRLGEALTRMLAHGLGNPEAFRPVDADLIVSHFSQDKGEEGGKTYSDLADKAVRDAVDIVSLPVTNEDAPEFIGYNEEVLR